MGFTQSPNLASPVPSDTRRDGAALIAAERRRQVEREGWTPEHDAEHDDGGLVEAAICYAEVALTLVAPSSPLAAAPVEAPPTIWPWERAYWKPDWDDSIHNLVRAGALIAAEIDRLARVAPTPTEEQG